MKCLTCGTEMECKIEGHCLSWVCKNCGDGLATSYFEPIELDKTIYNLCIHPVETPSTDQLRCISQLLSCNFLQVKNKLHDQISISDTAEPIRTIALALQRKALSFTITPSFPYEIKDEAD